MMTEPFLARVTLHWLTPIAPVVTLLIARLGGGPIALDRAAGCLLSTWVCTVLVGIVLRTVVNAIAPRLLSRAPLPLAVLGIVLVGAATVVASMALLVPRLTWLDPNLAGPILPFILQALGVGVFYVVVARLYTWQQARARASMELAKRSEELMLRARLAMLQSQVNPHFLFNTLNAIAALIPTDPDAAEATIERLAGVLQYAISSGKRGEVSLDEELSAVADYLAIERARFGARLRTEIDVDAALTETRVPPMLLQPLVENALLHGLSDRERGGEIVVRGRVEPDAMVLTVSDDGVGPGRSKRRGNSTGLANLRERIALVFGAGATMELRAREGGGCECELRLPRTSVA